MTTSPNAMPDILDPHAPIDMPASAAAQRALDYYLKSTPPLETCFFDIKPGINHEDALVHASDLLRSAAAAAYESASNRQGNQRDLAFSVVYLIDMAKAMMERSLQKPAVGQPDL